jgi:hypothetical protein
MYGILIRNPSSTWASGKYHFQFGFLKMSGDQGAYSLRRVINRRGFSRMLDMIAAIVGTADYALLVGVPVGLSRLSGATKFAAFATAAAWGGIIVVVAALGGFAPGRAGQVPVPTIAFAFFLVLLFGGWLVHPKFRGAALSVPLSAFVAVNAARLGGVFFLILTAQGRLSAPFGPAAGWGDITVGALAIPLAAMGEGSAARHPTWFRLWNWLGTLDLLNAITLGLLSAQGTPFRVFTEGPGTQAMGILPYVFVPAMLVPLYLLIHLTIAIKLRELRQSTRNIARSRLVSPHAAA